MNKTNYRNLKLRIKMWFMLITLVIFSISAFPIVEFCSFALDYWDIAPGGPLKAQENSTKFLLSVLTFSLLMVFLSTVLVTWLVAKVYGYSKEQCIDYFFRYENLPQHWLKRRW